MARKTIYYLIDDLDGSEATESVSFALDGTQYGIDLTADHAAELRATLAPYVAAGDKVGKLPTGKRGKSSSTSSTSSTGRSDTAEVREWARQRGHELKNRGRIPAHIQREYDEAHSPSRAASSTGSASSTGKRRKADKSSSTSSTGSTGSQESEPVPA